MRILHSVLREKHLRRIQRLQELQRTHERSNQSAQALASSQRVHEDARNLLWQTMNSSESLCVQRFGIARAQEHATAKAMNDAVGTHEANRQQLEKLTRGLARIDKDIEKLDERREEIARAAASDQLKADWSQLDAWMLSQQGAAK
jgi:hypothetical protein